MFFFFLNGIGLFGSIAVSLIVTVISLKSCS